MALRDLGNVRVECTSWSHARLGILYVLIIMCSLYAISTITCTGSDTTANLAALRTGTTDPRSHDMSFRRRRPDMQSCTLLGAYILLRAVGFGRSVDVLTKWKQRTNQPRNYHSGLTWSQATVTWFVYERILFMFVFSDILSCLCSAGSDLIAAATYLL